MKSLLFIALLCASFTAQADFIQNGSFYRLSQRAADIENHEYYINSEVVHHRQGYVDMSSILGKLVANQVGIETMELTDIDKEERLEEINKVLFSGYTPFFCWVLTPNFDVHHNTQACVADVASLLGSALYKADNVKILRLKGDFYGDWEEISIILSDYDTNESVVLSFDIIHEV